MRLNWKFLWLCVALALVLVGIGCGGINASQSVSPATFFLPGLGQTSPDHPQPVSPTRLAETAHPMARAE